MRIAIIGAGFAGTAVALHLQAFHTSPISVTLIEKRSAFGLGEAYSTPFLYHLLNVRAKDMSVFEHDLEHFTQWLKKNASQCGLTISDEHIANEFAPRALYGKYLQELLAKLPQEKDFSLQQEQDEAVALDIQHHEARIQLASSKIICADKVVLTLGNGLPGQFPFPIDDTFQCISDPWDFTAPQRISADANVMIIGTGLSMIDTVLTLHHQGHRGKIYALSRHGLLPLPHTSLQGQTEFPSSSLPTTKSLWNLLRKSAQQKKTENIDWRLVINGFRPHFPTLWKQASPHERKRFLRHALPYWNIHRHRVHDEIADVLDKLIANQQLEIMAGRVQSAQQQIVHVQPRGKHETRPITADWLINCMGPSMRMNTQIPLVHSILAKQLATLDSLQLGFAIAENFALIDDSGKISPQLYSVGSPTKGATWTCSSVPEIRRQCASLAKHLVCSEGLTIRS